MGQNCFAAITGMGGRIGAALARSLLARGVSVLGSDIDPKRIPVELRPNSYDQPVDVCLEGSVANFYTETMRQIRPPARLLLFTAASAVNLAHRPDEADTVFETSYFGVVNALRLFGRTLVSHGGRAIVIDSVLTHVSPISVDEMKAIQKAGYALSTFFSANSGEIDSQVDVVRAASGLVGGPENPGGLREFIFAGVLACALQGHPYFSGLLDVSSGSPVKEALSKLFGAAFAHGIVDLWEACYQTLPRTSSWMPAGVFSVSDRRLLDSPATVREDARLLDVDVLRALAMTLSRQEARVRDRITGILKGGRLLIEPEEFAEAVVPRVLLESGEEGCVEPGTSLGVFEPGHLVSIVNGKEISDGRAVPPILGVLDALGCTYMPRNIRRPADHAEQSCGTS